MTICVNVCLQAVCQAGGKGVTTVSVVQEQCSKELCLFQIVACGCVRYGLCVQSVTVRSAEDERKDRSCVCHRH